eukprot:6432708-Pyramimonas_sp.AAC.1
MAATCTRIPTNLWRCTCKTAGKPAGLTEHALGWCGQGAHKAELRNKTRRELTQALYTSTRARVDKGVRTYVQFPKNCPEWNHVVIWLTMNLDDNAIIQDIKIQDQPIGYNYNAPFPNGVTNVRTRFYTEQPEA